MRTHLACLLIGTFVLLVAEARAAVLYVDLNCTSPVAPYTAWSTAATNIQQAVDVSTAGDLVLVTNGVYQTGGLLAYQDSTSNRLAVTKAVTVQSVNGPATTTIQGFQVPGTTNGTRAVRCVFLTNGAALIGFTLTNGATQSGGSGGGVTCASTSSLVSNCVLVANSAGNGGGASSGTFSHCIFSDNTAGTGGGAISSVLNNCLLIRNRASRGGAVASRYGLSNATSLNNCTVYGNSASSYGGGFGEFGPAAASYGSASNCIIFGNTAPYGSNYSTDYRSFPLNYCCASPLPTNGAGNVSGDPLFVAPVSGDFRLQSNSPCINAGSAGSADPADLAANARLIGAFVDLGAFEYQLPAPVPLFPAVQASFTQVGTGVVVVFTGQLSGHATSLRWDFADGTIISNQLPNVSHSWTLPGNYSAGLWAYNDSYPNGVSAVVTINVLANPVHYVSLDSLCPSPPYLTWATAATNIQDAVDAAYVGGTVLVSNGLYTAGGHPIAGENTRVAVSKPLTLRSLNGPAVTVIQGSTGNGAVRCVYLTNNVLLTGFTLTNGSVSGIGAGVYCASTSASVSNCIITGNTAGNHGGGAYSGSFANCSFVGNYGIVGGGATVANLSHCILSNNSAIQGGAARDGIIENCLLVRNSAQQGGAILVSTPNAASLNNCTISDNYASLEGGAIANVWGSAAQNLSASNCIILGNSSNNGSNYNQEVTFNFCCTTPLPAYGVGNIGADPLFVDAANGDYRLQSNSPCINAGDNSFVSSSDLDGHPRIAGGTVDLGAYEFQSPASVISYAYLQQYGLPTDGSVDFADTDGDGMNNWQEWRAGTIPTNSSSLLRMVAVIATNNPPGFNVSWASVPNRAYFLQRSLDLYPPFSTIQSNIPGQAGTTTYLDTSAPNSRSFFYRVGVR